VVDDVSNHDGAVPSSVSLGRVTLAGDEIGKRSAVLIRRIPDAIADEANVAQYAVQH